MIREGIVGGVLRVGLFGGGIVGGGNNLCNFSQATYLLLVIVLRSISTCTAVYEGKILDTWSFY